MSKKYDYLSALISTLDEKELREVVQEFAKQNKEFEAFVIGKSGKVVDTGRTFGDFQEELEKLMKKCQSRRGHFKVTRLQNAGLSDFWKNLQAHFSNSNFQVACWMSLALMNMLHQVILMNTRYPSSPKPFKVFEKMFLEARDRLDSSLKFFDPGRKDRQQIFGTLVECWWREQLRVYEHQYFESDDLFQYAKRDEDFLALQRALEDIASEATELDEKRKKMTGGWKRLLGEVVGTRSEKPLHDMVKEIQAQAAKRMEDWE